MSGRRSVLGPDCAACLGLWPAVSDRIRCGILVQYQEGWFHRDRNVVPASTSPANNKLQLTIAPVTRLANATRVPCRLRRLRLQLNKNVRQTRKQGREIAMKWGTLYFILTVFCLFTGETKASGQFGVVGGLNISSWSADVENQDSVARTDFTIGGSATFPLSQGTRLRFEGLYSRKHGDLDLTVYSAYSPGSPREAQYKTDFEYIEFPLLLDLSRGLSKNTRALILLGPVASFKLSSKFEVELPEGTHSTGETSGDLEGAESLDVGGLIGIGLETVAQGRPVGLSVRYNHGLTEVTDGFGGPANRTVSLLFSIGL